MEPLHTARRLSAAVLAVSNQLTVPEVLQTIVDTARELAAAEYAALGVPDDDGSFAQFLVSGVSAEQQAAIGPLPRQHGFLAVMLTEPVTQRLDDIRADPRFDWWPAAHPVLKAFLGVPITSGDEILGALYLANKPGGFTDEDTELVRVLAAHAAIALTHARLYARNRELTIAEERARIAHDLHDAVAQRLFGLRLTAQAADLLIDRDPAAARARLAEVSALAREATEELHAAVLELRPARLAEDGLPDVLRKQVQILDRASGPALVFHEDNPVVLPPAQQAVMLRVAQEALHNAVRHSGASRIEVRLAGTVLEVADDGTGFDVDATIKAGRSLGLRSMRDRACQVRGKATITSSPGGTTVRLEVPGA
ncbi:GAF domain-containing sensor histidine kinase [Paractinoplanes lichenicola]|uniref:GAF domain-containing sensor histidine kinase n=1 Tax=Paractinoplanes lichenicola TaxID=2802976 RepID=A0ABS1VZL4_9ACTN|nr:GAF domain-containing sensor histidine kinase [Actinoplanes lichenicola]MBL7259926.1 GAF domain-containing sensor histidine kinase [Actinoplanes lichenicola]